MVYLADLLMALAEWLLRRRWGDGVRVRVLLPLVEWVPSPAALEQRRRHLVAVDGLLWDALREGRSSAMPKGPPS